MMYEQPCMFCGKTDDDDCICGNDSIRTFNQIWKEFQSSADKVTMKTYYIPDDWDGNAIMQGDANRRTLATLVYTSRRVQQFLLYRMPIEAGRQAVVPTRIKTKSPESRLVAYIEVADNA